MEEMFVRKPDKTTIGKRMCIPSKVINDIPLSKDNLGRIFIYTIIAGAKNNTITYGTISDMCGCSWHTVKNNIQWLIKHNYLGIYKKGFHKADQVSGALEAQGTMYKIHEGSKYNVDWNLFTTLDINKKYGTENLKAFGLYFFMRAYGNDNKFGNDWLKIGDNFYKKYKTLLYILKQYGLITVLKNKDTDNKYVIFEKERTYEFNEQLSIVKLKVKLSDKQEEQLNKEDARKNNSAPERVR